MATALKGETSTYGLHPPIQAAAHKLASNPCFPFILLTRVEYILAGVIVVEEIRRVRVANTHNRAATAHGTEMQQHELPLHGHQTGIQALGLQQHGITSGFCSSQRTAGRRHADLPDMKTAEYCPLELLMTRCLNCLRDGSTTNAGDSGRSTKRHS